MTNKERMQNVFNNVPADRIPVGFWFHFLPAEQHNAGLGHPELMQINRAGHKAFIEAFNPDLIKVMTDGLFVRPADTYPAVTCASDLAALEPLPQDHPYFAASLSLARDVRAMAGEDAMMLFNVFSPLFNLAKFMDDNDELTGLYAYMREDPRAVAHALEVLSGDMQTLADLVLTQGGMDGLYVSVNNSREVIPAETYVEWVRPSELALLEAANRLGGQQTLHICGNRTRKNNLALYRDYPVTVFNWAVHEEGMSLAEGKRFFHDKCVVGGFNQYPGSLIHKGGRRDIEAYVETLLADCGKTGVIVGADCTVPSDTPLEHLQWVREKAAELSRQTD